MTIRSWSTTAASNNSNPPNGWPEGMVPSAVNNTARQMMADLRESFEALPFFDYGHTPTRVDNDTITILTDLTATYTTGRRIKLVGATTGYGTITSSSYSAPDTTINIDMDSGNVPTSLSTVSLGPDKAYLPGHLKYHGAVGDGVTNDTTAVQAAVDSGYPVYAPDGTYLIDTITWPNNSSGLQFHGAGIGKTIFQARTANTVLFKKVASSGTMEGAGIGNFSVKAHASGSTTAAILCTGMRHCHLFDIEGLSNGSFGFNALFDLSANPYHCYSNQFSRPRLSGTAGWGHIFYFNNNGAGSSSNCNVTSIYDIWAVDNTGMTSVINAVRSASTKVHGGLIENNTGALAIAMGQGMVVTGVWLELNGTDIDFASAEAGSTANNCLVAGNYFSEAATFDFHSVCTGNLVIGNTAPNGITFANSPDRSNRLISLAAQADPAAPTYAYSAGTAGTYTLVTGTLVDSYDPIDNSCSFKIDARWTPNSASGRTDLAISLPAGFAIRQIHGSGVNAANGVPIKVAVNASGTLSVENDTTDQKALFVWGELYKT